MLSENETESQIEEDKAGNTRKDEEAQQAKAAGETAKLEEDKNNEEAQQVKAAGEKAKLDEDKFYEEDRARRLRRIQEADTKDKEKKLLDARDKEEADERDAIGRSPPAPDQEDNRLPEEDHEREDKRARLRESYDKGVANARGRASVLRRANEESRRSPKRASSQTSVASNCSSENSRRGKTPPRRATI